MILLNQLDIGKRVRIQKIMPLGSLEARKNKYGQIQFCWRGSVGHKTERINIGFYDSRRPPKSLEPGIHGYSIAAAIKKAEEIARLHQEYLPLGGLKAFEQLQQHKRQQEDELALEQSQYTFARLLAVYVDYLQEQERKSWREIQGLFRNHILTPFAFMASRQATEIEAEDIALIMRRLFEAGKGRTGNKVRAYIGAAFELAKQAKVNPALPSSFLGFKVRHNPASETVPDKSQNRADKNPLRKPELLTYWQCIQYNTPECALLRLHFLTGGQRLIQLLRLKKEDIHEDYFILYDFKGRPGLEPRQHIVPIPEHCQADLALAMNAQGEYAFSTNGENLISSGTLSHWAAQCIQDRIPNFKLKRIRSGVETLLASMGVNQEIRGRLQSHGISGVQSRHYNDYDYLKEKKMALDKIWDFLNNEETI